MQHPTPDPTTRARLAPWRDRRATAATASVLLATAILAGLILRNASDLARLRDGITPIFLVPAFAAHSLALFAAAYNWHRITGTVARDSSLKRDLHIYVTTASARRLPGSLWGTALRIYWYRRLGYDWRAVGIVSLLETWSVTLAGALGACAGGLLFIGGALATVVWAGLLAVLGLLGALALPGVFPWLLRHLGRVIRLPDSASIDGARPREVAVWIAVSVGTWILGGLELAAILRAIGPYDRSAVPSIVTAWVVAGTAGMLITFVPGGFGVVELALTSLLSLMFPVSVALVASLAMRVFTTVFEVLWTLAGFGGMGLVRERCPDAPRALQ